MIGRLTTERSEAEKTRALLGAEIMKAAEELGALASALKNNMSEAFELAGVRGSLSRYADLSKLRGMLSEYFGLCTKISEHTATLKAAGIEH